MAGSDVSADEPSADEPSAGESREARRMRTALLLAIAGLIVEAFCLAEITPGTFLLFALVALPLVLAGLATFLWTVLGVMRRKESL